MQNFPTSAPKPCQLFTQFVLAALLITILYGCAKPDFMERIPTIRKPTPVPTRIDLQVTPRELLTARLLNPPAKDSSPPITVGKLIEFADRYLSCDCSGKRFVRTWEKTGGTYRLTTNSEFVRPLNFACQNNAEFVACYLSEIDRGSQVSDLRERFVPGSEFIQFIYENGLQCKRAAPCQSLEDET
jgi:hypothetical protein